MSVNSPASEPFASLMGASTHLLRVESGVTGLIAPEQLHFGPGVTIEACETLADALVHVARGGYDCALVVAPLADASALDAVKQLRVAAPELALVVVCDDERQALRALRLGAQEFLHPHELGGAGLFRRLQHAIERQRSEVHMQRLALHDSLTGLPNRRLFGDRLEQALTRRTRSGGDVAVLFADLDGFKAVNDTYGHGAGDELLRQAGARLARAVRTTDTVARIGGDEFAILCEQVGSDADAALVAQRVIDALETPFDLSGHGTRVTLSLSLGVACAGTGDALPGDLLRRSDRAMYEAKRAQPRERPSRMRLGA